MSEVEPFSDDVVDQVAAALDVNDQGSFWVELKHMEANGFDIAWQQPTVRGAILGSYESPFFERGDELPHSAERQLVLQLRDRLREELLMPPLPDEERRAWAYERIHWKQHDFMGSHEESKIAQGLTADQINLVVSYIKRSAPHVIDYMRSVLKHNQPYFDANDFYNKNIIGCMWVLYFAKNLVVELINPDGSVRTGEGDIAIKNRLWEEAGWAPSR